MRSLISRAEPSDLGPKLDAVRTLSELGEGRIPETEVIDARNLAARADERLGLGSGFTVVALAGATGSGKSSLFNALAGSDVSRVGVRRPTTAQTSAAVWGQDPADQVLDWLDVERRHRVSSDGADGLVLLDLPDHDSTTASHRAEVDRILELADLFIWVVDPQKYADGLLHELYLRPLSHHAPGTLVVLNHADRLSQAEREQCVSDLHRLLEEDGLDGTRVVTTSAVTGLGLDELRTSINERVEQKRAAVQRLLADIHAVAKRYEPFCRGASPKGVSGPRRDALLDALADAAGAETVVDAAARSYRREAGLATGWAVTRWARRLRPDPLARLHLGRGTGGRTSNPPVSDLRRARVETGVRAVSAGASSHLPDPWPQVVRDQAAGSTDDLLEDLDRAIGRAEVQPARRPRWWAMGAWVQRFFLLGVIAGFVWLSLLFAFQWFQIPEPATPEVRSVPLPTLLFFGGLLLGFLSAVLFGLLARIGAARIRSRVRRSIALEVDGVAQRHVIEPIERELEVFRELCNAVEKARR